MLVRAPREGKSDPASMRSLYRRFTYIRGLVIPVEVLRERDERGHHVSLTAALMGDPLPGRSALDKRR